LKPGTLFISYKFNDSNAESLFNFAKGVAANLRRIRIVDGKSLSLVSGFSGEISDFIREAATCLVAIFVTGEHGNANVLFEVGVAVGASKPIVVIADSLDVVPTMLRHRHIHTVDRSIDWRDAIKARIEQQLRSIFQVPPDDMIEDKLARRYSDEAEYFHDFARLEIATTIIKQGDFGKAEAILRAMLKTSVHKTDILFLLADVTYLRGVAADDPLERERCFRNQMTIANSALEIEPTNVLALSALGAAQLRLGHFDEAKASLLTLLAKEKRFSVAHYNLACLAALLDQKKEMLDWLRKAIAINPMWRDFAKGDKDLTGFWQDADWRSLVY
jgi:tetratricopeptide (TPR) repeat protein